MQYVTFLFSQSQSTVLCWGIISMLSAIAMYGALFYDASRPYSAMEAGLFAGFHRFFWAVGTAGFIIVVTLGTVRKLFLFYPPPSLSLSLIYKYYKYVRKGEGRLQKWEERECIRMVLCLHHHQAFKY